MGCRGGARIALTGASFRAAHQVGKRKGGMIDYFLVGRVSAPAQGFATGLAVPWQLLRSRAVRKIHLSMLLFSVGSYEILPGNTCLRAYRSQSRGLNLGMIGHG
jgi:hypothetical protein